MVPFVGKKNAAWLEGESGSAIAFTKKRKFAVTNMDIYGHFAGVSRTRSSKQILVSRLSLALLFATWSQNLRAYQDAQAPCADAQAPPHAQQTPVRLQQLAAPIALFPDSLVAQILAASTLPDQVVEAHRWVEARPDLKGNGSRRRPTSVGSECQAAYSIPIRPSKYG